MKKLLYIPLQTLIKEVDDLFIAFSKEYETHFWTDKESAIKFKPDVVYIHSGAIDVNVLMKVKRNTKALWTQWTGDCRLELLKAVTDYKDLCDITFLACGEGYKKKYEKELKHSVYFLPHAVADWQFLPVKEDTKGIVMVANNYSHFPGGKERAKLAALLSKEFKDFQIIGNGWNSPQYNNKYIIDTSTVPRLYNASYIATGGNSFNNIKWYFSNRPLMAMAAGTCYIIRYVPGLEDFFTDEKDCVFYKKPQEVAWLIKELAKNNKMRTRIAKSGQQKMRKYHKYENRVQEFTQAINEL